MDYSQAIKQINQDDAALPEALAMIWRVFEEFEAPDYSDEGIQEFRRFIALNAIKEGLGAQQLILWCCFEEAKVIGAIAVRPPCHIALLFVDKAYQRRGIARSLYRCALDFCAKNSQTGEMTVNSSPYAIEAYHRLGFVDTMPEQVVNGLGFTPMKHTFR